MLYALFSSPKQRCQKTTSLLYQEMLTDKVPCHQEEKYVISVTASREVNAKCEKYPPVCFLQFTNFSASRNMFQIFAGSFWYQSQSPNNNRSCRCLEVSTLISIWRSFIYSCFSNVCKDKFFLLPWGLQYLSEDGCFLYDFSQLRLVDWLGFPYQFKHWNSRGC